LNKLVGQSLSNLLGNLTSISSACPTGSNLLRVNIKTHSNIDVGILTLYATAKGNLALALKLNCNFVLTANTNIIIKGMVLGLPLDFKIPVSVSDGGLVSCVVHTITTAIPFTGCLLAGLNPNVDVNLPLNENLGPDGTGCTGLIPGLAGSLLAALGINLDVTITVSVAQQGLDGICTAPARPAPLTVSLLLGRQHLGQAKGCAPVAPPCKGCMAPAPQPPVGCGKCKVITCLAHALSSLAGGA
jgi:hypothetical protein